MRRLSISLLLLTAPLLAQTTETSLKPPPVLPAPPVLVAVEMEKPKIVAGNSGSGTITIDRAVNYDLTVSLTFDPPSAATLPEHVTVPHGATSAPFEITTPASADDLAGTIHGTIYGNFNTTKTLAVTIYPTTAPSCDGTNADYCTNAICYKCFFGEPSLPKNFIEDYKHYSTSDLLVQADRDFIVWRATATPNCDTLASYTKDLATETDADRKLQAYAVLGFSQPECDGADTQHGTFRKAALVATTDKRIFEAKAFNSLAAGTFKPQFGDVAITTNLSPVNGATTMVLGDSTIELNENTRIGTQVERVFRDWVSSKLDWSGEFKPAKLDDIIPWGEGQAVVDIMKLDPKAEVFPLVGTLIARRAGEWYGPDENGVFRFNILPDKVQYPTTHVDGNVGWIIDTHGTSALVSQALEYNMQTVIACGDSIGKAKAAYYLATHGVNVINMADRYEYLLLGYEGKGTIIGNAPVHMYKGKPVVGHQPITFSLSEPFIAEDTKMDYPMQYYDAAARYFRRLASMIPINVYYQEVTQPNQLDLIFTAAQKYGSTAIGVRIQSKEEDAALREWLKADKKHRAILFHSGLYAYAQGLFADFPAQVTFGDLHPRFQR